MSLKAVQREVCLLRAWLRPLQNWISRRASLVEAAARRMTGHPVKAFGFATQGGEREIA
jgi:hypothetical protein